MLKTAEVLILTGTFLATAHFDFFIKNNKIKKPLFGTVCSTRSPRVNQQTFVKYLY